MRARLVTGAAIGVVGALVFTAGIAWPRDAAPAALPAADRTAGLPVVPAEPSPSTVDKPAPVPSRSSAAPSPTPGPTTPPPVPGWTLVDYDDFTGTQLDRTRWGVYDSLATNKVSTWSPSMVTVTAGELRIAGHGRNPHGDGNVSGGLCWCRGDGDQTYGMWQVRARFDAGYGYGQALILWPKSGRWPQDGELDFVETPTPAKKTAVQTIHWGSDNQTDDQRVAGDFTQWHVYAVIWRPGDVQMLIDGKVYFDTATSGSHPDIPHNPMHLAIQQEPGPLNPDDWIPAPGAQTPDQVTMHLDWVRLYRQG